MLYPVFILLYLYLCNRQQLRSFIEGLRNRSRQEKREITDKSILEFIKKKTGVRLSKILVFKMDSSWGMMAGVWPKPVMILSEDVMERLNKDELQWVLLHEAGHYILWHSVKMVSIQIVSIVSGVFMISRFPVSNLSYLLAVCLGVVLSVLYFQIAREFEREANSFALEKVDNPRGVMTVAEKAKERWVKKGFPLNSFKQILFNIWIYDLYLEQADKARLRLKATNKL